MEMLSRDRSIESLDKPRSLRAHWAQSPEDLLAAQDLRYRVFVEEMGARVVGAELGLEGDRFDDFCDHLLVREGEGGRVVGTYRALAGGQAARLGGFYSDGEFDLGARVKDALAAALRGGETVAAFPEGTTSDGLVLGRFYPALFQAAVDARADVQPVAIRYRDESGQASRAAAFIGDMTVADSLRLILREPCLVAEIVFCPPISSLGRTRRELASLAHASIARTLGFDCPALDDWLGPWDQKRAA